MLLARSHTTDRQQERKSSSSDTEWCGTEEAASFSKEPSPGALSSFSCVLSDGFRLSASPLALCVYERMRAIVQETSTVKV